MKICLETPLETRACDIELARVKKYNDGKPAELMLKVGQAKVGGPVDASLVRVDGISPKIKAMPEKERRAIAKAIRSGTTGTSDWALTWDAESRANFPQQFTEKLNAIVAELEA